VTRTLVTALTLAAVSSPSSAQETRYLYANSLCKHPMRILVYHKDTQAPHHAHAWYFFRPYEENRLQASGVVLRQIVGADLYVYAETTEGELYYWRGTDVNVMWDNVYYQLRRMPLTVNARGELEFRFTCSR
jgi:hypothetical protein